MLAPYTLLTVGSRSRGSSPWSSSVSAGRIGGETQPGGLWGQRGRIGPPMQAISGPASSQRRRSASYQPASTSASSSTNASTSPASHHASARFRARESPSRGSTSSVSSKAPRWAATSLSERPLVTTASAPAGTCERSAASDSAASSGSRLVQTATRRRPATWAQRSRGSWCLDCPETGSILRGSFQPMLEMVIYGVSFDMVGKQPIVLLKTRDGNKFLPIWIGHPEAAAILMKLQGATTPRPMTHDLINDMLGELDVSCSRVSVTELRENTFYASITLTVNGREVEIDSRPSDALALAVRSGAPIFAAEDVIAESAIEFEHEVEDTEEVVDKFKEFLDQVSPEDFGASEQ